MKFISLWLFNGFLRYFRCYIFVGTAGANVALSLPSLLPGSSSAECCFILLNVYWFHIFCALVLRCSLPIFTHVLAITFLSLPSHMFYTRSFILFFFISSHYRFKWAHVWKCSHYINILTFPWSRARSFFYFYTHFLVFLLLFFSSSKEIDLKMNYAPNVYTQTRTHSVVWSLSVEHVASKRNFYSFLNINSLRKIIEYLTNKFINY